MKNDTSIIEHFKSFLKTRSRSKWNICNWILPLPISVLNDNQNMTPSEKVDCIHLGKCVGSILQGGPTELFLVLPVLHDWCNKGHGVYYPVYGGDAYKTLAANRKEYPMWQQRSHVAAPGFLSQSKWSFTICLMPYNRK